MKRLYAIFGLIPLLHLLASCATVPPMQTVSGRPEVTVLGVDKKQIINAIANDFVNAGCQIKSMNDFSVVVSRASQNVAVNLLLSSQYDSTVEERTSFQLLDMQGGVRVLGSAASSLIQALRLRRRWMSQREKQAPRYRDTLKSFALDFPAISQG